MSLDDSWWGSQSKRHSDDPQTRTSGESHSLQSPLIHRNSPRQVLTTRIEFDAVLVEHRPLGKCVAVVELEIEGYGRRGVRVPHVVFVRVEDGMDGVGQLVVFSDDTPDEIAAVEGGNHFGLGPHSEVVDPWLWRRQTNQRPCVDRMRWTRASP